MFIDLTCEICGKCFQRRKAEHNRNLKKGRKIYCSLKCSGKGNLLNLPLKDRQGNCANLVSGCRLDEFSPFRWHLNVSKQRTKKKNDLTLEYLKELWEKQGGICPYTGWKLRRMRTTSTKDQLPKTPDRASLDRIDNSKGYVKGNVQFVSLIAQLAKYEFEKEDVYRFCEAVVKNQGNRGENDSISN